MEDFKNNIEKYVLKQIEAFIFKRAQLNILKTYSSCQFLEHVFFFLRKKSFYFGQIGLSFLDNSLLF